MFLEDYYKSTYLEKFNYTRKDFLKEYPSYDYLFDEEIHLDKFKEVINSIFKDKD